MPSGQQPAAMTRRDAEHLSSLNEILDAHNKDYVKYKH